MLIHQMRQILQNLKTGKLELADVPPPVVQPGCLLIQTRCSLISSGTERMLVSFSKSNLISKARQQPEKVKQVIDKMKTDGILPTIHTVFSRLDEPLPLGYCNFGTVVDVGDGVDGFNVGDRVANNGPHAEIVCVLRNLCAKVPDSVSDEQAAFTVLASIGLQGIRLLHPTFGETIVVFGLGLIGLMSVQLLRNSGCKVIGIDISRKRLELAKKYGAETIDVASGADAVETALALTNGRGVDGVLITASAHDDTIVHDSAAMCRKRGRIVLVGVVDLHINRADFYEKELTFQVSCSYGPGRYDTAYENRGQDYPVGFVRWTEQRNFEAVLNAFADGSLEITDLLSEKITFLEAHKAYKMLMDDPGKMGLLLTYSSGDVKAEKTVRISPAQVKTSSVPQVVAGLIGAGNFAKMTLLPAIKNSGIRLKSVADINGVAASHAARKFGFETSTNDYYDLLNDPEINTLIITTRPFMHATMVTKALEYGKHVHVEKPLCINNSALESIKSIYNTKHNSLLHVGFNRRFSPHIRKIKSLVSTRNGPLCMNTIINAGKISSDVWIQDKNITGGRIISEGCHWLDMMVYITGQPIISVQAMMVGNLTANDVPDDKMSVVLGFADGSIGTLNYFANGHKSFPKEILEVFCDEKVLKLNNFKELRGYGWKNFSKMNLWSQDKGHKNQFKCFINSITHGCEPLITFAEIENVTLASFAAFDSAHGKGKLIL